MDPNNQNNPNEVTDMTKKLSPKPSSSISLDSSPSQISPLPIVPNSNAATGLWNNASLALKLALTVFVVIVLTSIVFMMVASEKTIITTKSPAKATVAPTAGVTLSSDGFTPASITVKAGTQIIW